MYTSRLLSLLLLSVSILAPSVLAETPLHLKRATPTSCSTSLASPTPMGYICGQTGTVNDPGLIMATTLPNQSACRDLCLNTQPSCVSFSYGPGRHCKTYNKKVLSSQFRPSAASRAFWNRHCYKKTCGLCPSGLQACGSQCLDTSSEAANCGSCGNACGNGASCSEGQCSCPPESGFCSTGPSAPCVDLTTIANCGTCGNSCGAGAACTNGQCMCPANSQFCSTDPGAPCVDTENDDDNCGRCGNACIPELQTCYQSSCVLSTCAAAAAGTQCVVGISGPECCANQCTDTSSDANNCGRCGVECQFNEICISGQCGCPNGQLGDNNNCATCGNVCQNGQICSGGSTCECAVGNLGDDNNCGTCGNKCDNSTYCSQGQCVIPPNQLVVNPSFETHDSYRSAPPWTGIGYSGEGAVFATVYTGCDTTLCGYDGDAYLLIDGDSPGGTRQVSQQLQGALINRSYAFSAYVGRYDASIKGRPTANVTVYLDGQVIVPFQSTCPTDDACNLQQLGSPPRASYYGFRQITGIATPTNHFPNLVIEFSESVPADDFSQHPQDAFLDLVTLTLM